LKYGRRIVNSVGAAALSLLVLISTLFSAPQSALASHNITVGGKATVTNTDGDTIRVRENAGTEYDQIAEAYEGQTVSVLDGPRRDQKGNRWFRIKGPGGTGWIVAGFLEDATTPAQQKAIQQAAKPAVQKVVAKLTGFARVANTDGDPLRIRAAATAGGKVLTTFRPDTVAAIKAGPTTDDAGTVWYKVSANGVTGWAMAQYLVQAKAPAQQPAAKQPAVESKPAEQPKAEPAVEARSASSRGAEPVVSEANYSSRGQDVVNIAIKYVGSRYVYGGTTPRGFDCSGFTYYVYNQAGVRLSRDMRTQLNTGTRISAADLQPGDLLFWQNTYKRGLSHVGIYIGGGKFVHAANERSGVLVSSMNTAYWASRYVGAARPR
jgi:cell wall-associated NlpC family hydrolase